MLKSRAEHIKDLLALIKLDKSLFPIESSVLFYNITNKTSFSVGDIEKFIGV